MILHGNAMRAALRSVSAHYWQGLVKIGVCTIKGYYSLLWSRVASCGVDILQLYHCYMEVHFGVVWIVRFYHCNF